MVYRSTFLRVVIALLHAPSCFALYYYYEKYVVPYKNFKRAERWHDRKQCAQAFAVLEKQWAHDNYGRALSATEKQIIEQHIGIAIDVVIRDGFKNVVDLTEEEVKSLANTAQEVEVSFKLPDRAPVVPKPSVRSSSSSSYGRVSRSRYRNTRRKPPVPLFGAR